MQSKIRAIIWILVATLMIPGLASARREGRLVGIVVDPDGNPIDGVKVTATSKQVPGFVVIEVTDEKGTFKVDFEEIDRVYNYVMEKPGYVTLKTEQLWEKVGTARHQFVMYPGDDPVVADLAATVADPAVEAYNEGAAAFAAKKYDEAVAAFKKAVEEDPELRQGWAALGAAYLEIGRYQEAADAAEKAMEMGSSSELVLRTRWDAYRRLGNEEKTAEAEADLLEIGKLAEEARKVYNEGVALLQSDDKEAAFAKFAEASELDPNLQEAQLAIATTGLQLGRNAEALAAAKAILQEHPGNAEAIKIRYNAALALGDEAELVDALVQLALVDAATAAEGLRLLALAAYDASDMERAKERFKQLLEIEPNNARGHYFLGLIYLNESAKEQAEQHLSRFVELAPEDPDTATAQELLNYLKSS